MAHSFYARFMRTICSLFFTCLLTSTMPSYAQEQSATGACCHALAAGLPIDGLAIAVGTAGGKPLWVMPEDDTKLDFELEGVCQENLITPLLRGGYVRARDCGESYGLFGASIPNAEATCDNVAAPASKAPPGDLEGWAPTAVFTNHSGARLAVLSGPNKESRLIRSGDELGTRGATVEGIGTHGILVSRDGTNKKRSGDSFVVSTMGARTAPACVPINEELDESGETVETYACDDLDADFIQQSLPVTICDDPLHWGTTARAVAEFGPDGWIRRLVSLEANEGLKEALAERGIRDWRIVPIETTEGTLGRVRLTVEFSLIIPCLSSEERERRDRAAVAARETRRAEQERIALARAAEDEARRAEQEHAAAVSILNISWNQNTWTESYTDQYTNPVEIRSREDLFGDKYYEVTGGETVTYEGEATKYQKRFPVTWTVTNGNDEAVHVEFDLTMVAEVSEGLAGAIFGNSCIGGVSSVKKHVSIDVPGDGERTFAVEVDVGNLCGYKVDSIRIRNKEVTRSR